MKYLLIVSVLLLQGCQALATKESDAPARLTAVSEDVGEIRSIIEPGLVMFVFDRDGSGRQAGYFVEFPAEPVGQGDVAPRFIYQE